MRVCMCVQRELGLYNPALQQCIQVGSARELEGGGGGGGEFDGGQRGGLLCTAMKVVEQRRHTQTHNTHTYLSSSQA